MRAVLLLSFLVGCGTAPDKVSDPDSDGDGLLDSEEAELGTDPTLADSDGDGFSDSEEIDAGYNPTWVYSHAFEEGDYLIGSCPNKPDEESAGPTGEGVYSTSTWDAYQEGDVMKNLVNTDAYDQETDLYSFCGNYTVVTQSAEWCGPCQNLASMMQDDMATVRETVPNFTFYEELYQDNNGDEPDARVLNKWKRNFELDGIPVVSPPDNTAEDMNWINASGGIPATLLVAPDMTVIWSGVDHPREYYIADPQTILDAIAAYEGQ
jgi:thiol-disulfide isomerase/thioredoxin